MDDLLQSIGELANSRQRLAHVAARQYSAEVEAILKARSRDSRRIERCLDGMLDFCFDNGVLELYKRLCRYYFAIDHEATASYMRAYREMWKEKQETNWENISPQKTMAAEIRRTQEVLRKREALSLTPPDKTRAKKTVGKKQDAKNARRKRK